MARKLKIKQFRQACKELGLSTVDRYRAREALHDFKQSSGARSHLTYRELLEWLRQWSSADD